MRSDTLIIIDLVAMIIQVSPGAPCTENKVYVKASTLILNYISVQILIIAEFNDPEHLMSQGGSCMSVVFSRG